MEKYDYLSAVKEDVKQWIEEHDEWKSDYADENGKWLRDDNRDDIEQDLNDRLFIEDNVTGNASGSYTFNTWQAEENLCHNLDLLGEALTEFVAIQTICRKKVQRLAMSRYVATFSDRQSAKCWTKC